MRPLLVFAAVSILALVVGCGHSLAVSAPTGAAVTFNRDVAPILQANCASCHRPGEAAPFSLMKYSDAKRRSSQIAEVTRRRFMPPWLPEQGHETFANARRLTDAQIETLQQWAKTGAAEGEPTGATPAPAVAGDWQLGEPDLVLESPPYSMAADGADQFRNFVIPIAIDTPRWVESIELRPTNPRATHHARLGVDRSLESERRDAADPQPGYEGMAWGQDPDGQLVTWVPGVVAHAAAPGAAWRLYPKTCLVLHTHMQVTGKPETVQFHIGVHFAKQAPTLRPVILRVGSRDIDIKAGDANYVVTDEFVAPVDLDVRSIFPHAHSVCRTVSVEAHLPDGSKRRLISIKDFDERWHDDYHFVEPVRLPRGTRIRSTFTYENTNENIRNRHHPATRIVYGSNVADEMADTYLQVTAVKADERAALVEALEQYDTKSQLVGLRKTLEMYPDDPWSREGLASCYLALGQPKEAIRWLEERIKLGADPVYATVALAGALLADGDPARAEQLTRKVVDKDAKYPLAWLGLGKSLDARAKTAEAEKAYRRAIALAPALTDARLALADNLMKQAKPREAALTCEEAIKISPDSPNAFLKLAGLQANEKLYDASFRSLEAAHELAPYTHPPRVLLASYYFRNGEGNAAKKLLVEAHDAAPDHPVPELFLGQFAAREKRFDDARQFLEKSASRPIPANWPESHKKRFMVLLSTERFKLAQQLRDEKLARAAVDEWIKYDPENRQVQEIYNALHPTGIR
jgi:tetratricopeptide (TPR) repeat protein